MKRLPIFYFIFILLPIVNAVCTVPNENIDLKENIIFCFGAYNIQSGINIVQNNVVVDCNNSVLMGNGIGYGILLNKRQNVIVKNCNITNYEIGIYLDGTNKSVLKNNYLTNNKFGIASFNSFDNDIDSNILSENLENTITYLPTSFVDEKGSIQTRKKEEISNPQKIMEEVVKIKKPFLNEADVVNEVNLILDRYFNTTRQNLEIKRTLFYNESDKSTRIILNLKPRKVLINVSIYERIPKCVSTYVNQILFEAGGYEVIKNDPLIMWSFLRLDKEKDLSYKVFKNIDKECKNLLFSFGIATGFKEFEAVKETRKNTNWLGFLVAAGIILILYYIIQTSRQN